MLPSRGLRPAQFAPLASRQPALVSRSAARKYSSLPRTAGLCASPCRRSALRSARWTAGATGSPRVLLGVSSVRYGSWYAPWSWGKSTPATDATTGAEQIPIAEFVNNAAPHSTDAHTDAVVTSQTPELAPAGIDQPAVVNSTEATATAADANAYTAFNDSKTIKDLLGAEPPPIPKPDFDPTALVDHAGQLQQMGLEYGWGMTTVFEKMIEQLYLQSGWGWAGSIMAASVGVRCATFFFQALSSDKMAAMAALKPVTGPLQEKMEAAIARGDKQQEHIYKMQQAEVLKPYASGIFSMGGFMIVQGWIGFCAFRFLRAMSALPVPGMDHDGFLWFADLTLRDPYFILPATTTAVFYAVFKAGGETGITDQGPRQTVMTFMAFFLGIVTAWQPAGLQLYFLCSGILGAGTGWLLRQNWFRNLIRIRLLPSRESTELYTRVVKGELRLSDIKGADGKVRYQAPTARTPANRRTTTTLSGIKIKSTAPVPAHLKVQKTRIDPEHPDRDEDYEEGARGSMMDKLDYYRRNYRLSFMYRRMTDSLENMARKRGFGGPKMTTEQRRKKKNADDYEIERRRRFENRS